MLRNRLIGVTLLIRLVPLMAPGGFSSCFGDRLGQHPCRFPISA
jgi:hypothetical protein